MPRRHIFEFHDLRFFPGAWRDVVTDVLRVFSIQMNPYRPVFPRLLAAMARSGASGVLDLCSGSSGPWEDLHDHLQRSGLALPVLLTDKYPHQGAIQAASLRDGIRYMEESVDAMAVPAHLTGFRTLFASFHHFKPAEARRILQDAVEAGSGIAVLEFTERTFVWFLASLFSPVFFWLASPLALRPFTFQHLLWIYLLPLPMLSTIWDSLVSCLRTYSPRELKDLVTFPGADGYEWDIGRIPVGGLRGVTYLIGIPWQRT